MQVSWRVALRMIAMAVGLTLVGNALFLLAVLPHRRISWVLMIAGLLISGTTVPREHRIRAAVAASCLAAILVFGSVFRQTFADWLDFGAGPSQWPDQTRSIVFVIVYAAPFFVWRAFTRRHATRRPDND